MPQPINNESRELLRLLGDGQWHKAAAVRATLCDRVPPGRAMRNYETREASRRAKVGPRTKSELSDDQRIDSGRRTLAAAAFYSMKRYLEFRGEEQSDAEEVRIKPGVPHPLRPVMFGPHGAITEDLLKAMVVDAVDAVVEEAFDEFAGSLQSYLDAVFAQLENHIVKEIRRPHRANQPPTRYN